jgi:hypothetical protein
MALERRGCEESWARKMALLSSKPSGTGTGCLRGRARVGNVTVTLVIDGLNFNNGLDELGSFQLLV